MNDGIHTYKPDSCDCIVKEIVKNGVKTVKTVRKCSVHSAVRKNSTTHWNEVQKHNKKINADVVKKLGIDVKKQLTPEQIKNYREEMSKERLKTRGA